MKNEKRITYHVYDDILNSINDINAWKSGEGFNILSLNVEQVHKLKKLKAIEVTVSGGQGISKDIETAFFEYEWFVKQFLCASNQQFYLIKIDHSSSPKSKLKSYKGMGIKSIVGESAIETEIDLPNGISYFGGIVLFNHNTFVNIMNLFYDSETTFILTSNTEEELFNKDFLNAILSSCVVPSTSNFIDYTKLLEFYCKESNKILRCAGDGGDVEIGLQIFLSEETLNDTLEGIKLI